MSDAGGGNEGESRPVHARTMEPSNWHPPMLEGARLRMNSELLHVVEEVLERGRSQWGGNNDARSRRVRAGRCRYGARVDRRALRRLPDRQGARCAAPRGV